MTTSESCANCKFFDRTFYEFCANPDHVFSIIDRTKKEPKEYVCSDFEHFTQPSEDK